MPGKQIQWLHPPTIAATFLLCCLIFVPYPVLSQTSTPSPSATVTALSETKDILQTFGVVTVALFVLLVGTVVLSLLAAWKIVLPLIQANSNANQQIGVMNQQTLQAQTGYLTALQGVSANVERTGNILSELETRQEAETRQKAIQDTLKENIGVVIEHTESVIQPVARDVSTAVTQLEAISKRMDDLVTNERFDGEMRELKTMVETVIDGLKPKTGPLDPAKVPSAPPPVPVKEGD